MDLERGITKTTRRSGTASRGVFATIFQKHGSVLPYALKFALPCALFSAGLKCCFFFRDQSDFLSAFPWAYLEVDKTAYGSFNFLLGFTVVFRSGQAYARFWDGATVAHQMLSSWWDSCASLCAFCRKDGDAPTSRKVKQFKQLLIRMYSILNALSMAELRGQDFENEFHVEVIDADGIDQGSLETLGELKCSPEVVLYWIEDLVSEAVRQQVLDIPAPIITRAFQELAIGMNQFKDATKIAKVPFPFPYSQAASMLLVIHWIITPFAMIHWSSNPVSAGFFVFILTLTFWMLHDIAQELENPFGDDANDLDLEGMQHEFNTHLLLLINSRVQRTPFLALSEFEDSPPKSEGDSDDSFNLDSLKPRRRTRSGEDLMTSFVFRREPQRVTASLRIPGDDEDRVITPSSPRSDVLLTRSSSYHDGDLGIDISNVSNVESDEAVEGLEFRRKLSRLSTRGTGRTAEKSAAPLEESHTRPDEAKSDDLEKSAHAMHCETLFDMKMSTDGCNQKEDCPDMSEDHTMGRYLPEADDDDHFSRDSAMRRSMRSACRTENVCASGARNHSTLEVEASNGNTWI